MNEQILSQITEIAKSVNIAFDGKLNSETLISITKDVTPQVIKFLYFYRITNLAMAIIWAVCLVLSAWLIGKAIIRKTEEGE